MKEVRLSNLTLLSVQRGSVRLRERRVMITLLFIIQESVQVWHVRMCYSLSILDFFIGYFM